MRRTIDETIDECNPNPNPNLHPLPPPPPPSPPGNPDSWEAVLGPDSPKLATLEAAMDGMARTPTTAEHRTFPYGTVLRLVWDNPKLISPGLALNAEIFAAFCKGKGKGKG